MFISWIFFVYSLNQSFDLSSIIVAVVKFLWVFVMMGMHLNCLLRFK